MSPTASTLWVLAVSRRPVREQHSPSSKLSPLEGRRICVPAVPVCRVNRTNMLDMSINIHEQLFHLGWRVTRYAHLKSLFSLSSNFCRFAETILWRAAHRGTARFQSLQSVSLTGNNSQAQESLASHTSPCITARGASSQMSDYPTLQYTADLDRGERRRRHTTEEEEEEEAKKGEK